MEKLKFSSDTNKSFKVAFIGHRQVFDKSLSDRLKIAVENEIKSGCKSFIMGTHGDFDRMALNVCRDLRKTYKDIKIEVVITSLAQIKPVTFKDDFLGSDSYTPYEDVETVMFDIEETYFKRKITESNKKMIDSSDALICYVDTAGKYASGAKTALTYAKKRGLTTVNLYKH